ncbi:MAG: GDP-mannose 4,6-dehydratase [Micavibrio aeruginosavorus]|uniref:GDP-mannose 4,6-dehydratase n=1 Tax=Micavibrio aeruginosavorus TaxID=349221 RepID=A0A2W5MZ56_9BACT|nr:MAG: GDP-mannose 4,6-dehydratase [Micavibrio aeruginosavorus]
MLRKTALITGITGQDGAVLAAILLEKGYRVCGLRPYLPVDDTERLQSISPAIELFYADLSDSGSLLAVLDKIRPDEIYNLAAMSHVQVSFAMPEHTGNINALGTTRLLEAMRHLRMSDVRFYQASSSEMFGNAPAPQCENTPFAPCSPYGASKLYAYWMVRMYRESYGFHASNGILFNHESPLRGEQFVTRKITRAIGEFGMGRKEPLLLGNLEAMRDWGHAHDYMTGAWMMLQQDAPDDYVLATGETHSVREFVEKAFAISGRTIIWHGKDINETGHDKYSGQKLVSIDPTLYRPQEIHCLIGDSAKARGKLGWMPRYSFDDLVAEMVEADSPAAMGKKLYG